MAEEPFRSEYEGQTIFDAVVGAARKHGGRVVAVEDALGSKTTYSRLLIGARVLGRRFAAFSEAGEIVPVLLPNANAVVAAFLGLISAGRVPAMLNYTAGPKMAVLACETVKARTVISARAFIEKAELQPLVDALEDAGMEMFWLEDVVPTVTLFEKATAALTSRRPIARSDPNGPALILFTSGSEGMPKAVVLSHNNILSNCAQVARRIEFGPSDMLFNVLPVFHSFGLTGGMVLPLVSGVKFYLYPSPLHFKIIPKTVAKVKPTIMFGTDTFLHAYSRTAKGSDFASLRLVVAGAEAVKNETRETWLKRFDTMVLEGFGMTEAAPVVAVNSPEEDHPGTVGQLLPGIESRLEPVEGIDSGGRLWVKGPNVMLGYMFHDRPGELQKLQDGWHDSGDIVDFDSEGYMTIKGRAKRFAKVAGEMVPLGAVEMMAQSLWPEDEHAAISTPDQKRGEKIVLVTTSKQARREALLKACKSRGCTELMAPNKIVTVDEIPVLGTGKIDYLSTTDMVAGKLATDKK